MIEEQDFMPKSRPTEKRRKASPSPAYPRPMLQRAGWSNLDGEWDFAVDADAEWTSPKSVAWKTKIQVPFAPETPASGVDQMGFMKAVWYRRTISTPHLNPGQRLILHFNAVDFATTVWINDSIVVHHEGGYTPFSADITDQITTDGNQTLTVLAADDPHDLAKPRGKQDWLERAHSIWYPRTTGIWQSVWM